MKSDTGIGEFRFARKKKDVIGLDILEVNDAVKNRITRGIGEFQFAGNME